MYTLGPMAIAVSILAAALAAALVFAALRKLSHRSDVVAGYAGR